MIIDNKDLYKTKRIKVKELYGNKEEKDLIGIVTMSPDGIYEVIDESGKTYNKNQEILEVSSVRNISKDIRSSLDNLGKVIKNKNKELEKLYKIKDELGGKIKLLEEDEEKNMNTLLDAYMKEYNVYTDEVFRDKLRSGFIDLLSTRKFDLSNYSFRKPNHNLDVFDNEIFGDVELYSQKYAREGSLGIVYQEYDGTMHLDVDSNKEEILVDRYLKKNNIYNDRQEMLCNIRAIEKRFDGISVKLINDVDIKDKNTLSLVLRIYISFDNSYRKDDELIERVLYIFENII